MTPPNEPASSLPLDDSRAAAWIEATVAWGDTVLAVHHLTPRQRRAVATLARLERDGLRVTLRRVAPEARRVPRRTRRRDGWGRVLLASAALVVSTVWAALHAAHAPDALLVSAEPEERLSELRGYVDRAAARARTDPPPPDARVEPGTAADRIIDRGPAVPHRTPRTPAPRETRARGPAVVRAEPGARRDALAARGVFAALASPVSVGPFGYATPFGQIAAHAAEGPIDRGGITDALTAAWGYGGLGGVGDGAGRGEGSPVAGPRDIWDHGTSWACGCDASIGSMGHGFGTGFGAYGHGLPRARTAREFVPAAPRLRPAPVTLESTVAPEAIRRVVRANLGQIARCHEQALAHDSRVAGRVVVRFVVGGDGAVLGAAVRESTVGAPGLSDCIASAVRRWVFPPPSGGGTATVTYPFRLASPE